MMELTSQQSFKAPGLFVGVVFLVQLVACSGVETDKAAPDADSPTVILAPTDTGLQATIRRTTNGVPHISSDTLEGAAFGAGFAQAQDNVCLLAESFVKARGERAKYFGPGENDINIINDFSYRSLRILSGAESEYAQLSPESLALLDGFTAGYNQYVEDTAPEDLPRQCNGAPWVRPIRPQDLQAYYRIVGQYASGNLFANGAVFLAVPPGDSAEPTLGMDSAMLKAVDPLKSATLDKVFANAASGASTALQIQEHEVGSNAWGIGSELTENGKGALLANPHFPYTGARRFYQMHMTVPGYLDVTGAGISGTALPLIGFNQNLGWSHTVSTSRRFTFYELTLKEDDDLVYIKDGEERPITSEMFRIEVANGSPTPTVLEREFYFSEYGPMLPAELLSNGLLGAWGDDRKAYTFRDANADMSNFLDTWLAMSQASSLAEFQQVFEECGHTRWTNTTYADDQGNAFYIDSSAVADLSDEALAVIELKRAASPEFNSSFVGGLTLLDGSTSRDDWQNSGCNGLVPYEKRPKLVRTDFVQNSNDSYWSTNPAEFLTGFSPLFGFEQTMLSARTRLGLTMVQNPLEAGFADSPPAGQDGKFSAEDLINVIYNNRSFFAETLLFELLERCKLIAEAPVSTGMDEERSVTQACDVLAGWNGVYDIDSVGAHVFRVFMGQFLSDPNAQYTVPFDPADPVGTPSTPTDSNRGTANDVMLVALARASDLIESVSIPYQAALGSVQVVQKTGGVPPGGEAELLDAPIAWHGATSDPDGGFNAIGAVGQAVAEDTVFPRIGQNNLQGSGGLSDTPGVGWRIDRGTSWHFGLEFGDAGPRAFGLLSYSQSTDPASPFFNDQSQRYSDKNFRQLFFTDADITSNLLTDGTTELTGVRVQKP
ncbi:MAG: penicillin acylase family protein [Granulosicoccus sp.]